MSRYYNDKEIELLAPAGTFDIFKAVIHANCDAVYFGGSILNMRMIRKGYNFSNEEIEEAIKIAHSLNKKVYITVNNLFGEEDLELAVPYLKFLEKAQPDALIIQDFALFTLAEELKLSIDLHSSVMMNVHNLASIKALRKMGVSRVVTSREMSLDTIRQMTSATDMEFEYFTHGDMCVSHGAQCVYSGMLFGMSSNRGRCLKPCRWAFQLKKDSQLYDPGFPLAVKDMCLYEHLPELINSGVTSFKIEGRMREKDFIVALINQYGDAIDRYIDAPETYDRKLGFDYLYDTRKRDLSSGYAFGVPGLDNINSRYEGTGKFYSTGKVFSVPTEEKELDSDRLDSLNKTIKAHASSSEQANEKAHLAVKVNSMAQAKLCLKKAVQVIYVSMDVFLPHRPFTYEEILSLKQASESSKIYIALPKMMTEEDFLHFDEWFIHKKLPVDGILFTSIGALERYADLGYDMIADSSLNIYNYKAVESYARNGANKATLSLEAPLKDMLALTKASSLPLEMIVHGTPTVLYLEHDLYENTKAFEAIEKEDNLYISNEILTLKTPLAEYPVYKDQKGRNHMTTAKEICYLNLLDALSGLGINSFRIEGTTYTVNELDHIINVYAKTIASEPTEELSSARAGYTLGALAFD